MIFVLLVLSLFNGVFFHIPKNYSSLIVYVVDFDGQLAPYQSGQPIVGPAIVQATESIAKSNTPHLGYVTLPPSLFNNDPIAVRRASTISKPTPPSSSTPTPPHFYGKQLKSAIPRTTPKAQHRLSTYQPATRTPSQHMLYRN